MFLAGLIACAVTGILVLIRIILGKTTFDRILAVNSLGTVIVIGIALHGFYSSRPEFLDIAIVYAYIKHFYRHLFFYWFFVDYNWRMWTY